MFIALFFSCKTEYSTDMRRDKKRLFTTIRYNSSGNKVMKVTEFPLSKKEKYINYHSNGKRSKKRKVKTKIYGLEYGYGESQPYGTHKFWNEEGKLIRKEKYSRINHELKKTKTF